MKEKDKILIINDNHETLLELIKNLGIKMLSETEHQLPTKCSSNKGFRGYLSVLPRIKFRVG